MNSHILRAFWLLFKVNVLCFLVVSNLLLYYMARNTKTVYNSDFVSYLTAGLLVREGRGERIYDLNTQSFYQKRVFWPMDRGDILPFRNPPFVALFFTPFAKMSFLEAYFIYLAFNIGILLVITVLISKTFKKLFNNKFWFILPFAFYPITLSLAKGQIAILLVLVTLLLYCFSRTRPFLAGSVYSLFLIKPHYFLFGFPFILLLIPDKKRFLKGVFISVLILLLVSLYVAGLSSIISYPNFLLRTESETFGSPMGIPGKGMVSLYSSLITFLPGSMGKTLSFLVFSFLYSLSLLFFTKRKGRLSFDRLFLIAIIFMSIFSTHTLPYDLSFLLIPIFILINSQKTSFLPWLLFVIPNLLVGGSQGLNPFILLIVSFYLLFNKKRKLLA
ncbi:hypothetical protein A3D00_03225 [Candidatus Woesebacteria bacterium RIFCSPHIGHO2_02_FULL_38_9]|uniref:DUF2029 domain-containing protein n=1 Tax=Candidatus Woesebacteria bacterium RIFCSPHIGHO2_01_FULL_39_28 TaxID=1802496 RepID=A0A1F7YHU9_9BACT|nr:MAG: hypothetical protein A2627_05670 [Candidatus Woesebacteria bacterium RIFCSPHIGHO2_01_FULL_39_28]OGM31480.1 MAG: hypothetical protein A3D00_03225 [Candidatus Woesebacteria bacterium RIFCSPHIGHO2_02_FULL_38_9]OGM56666.1 MAG: hypothetical protein A3A50_04865 [Candidatus Woesebacteria bacterium RIFCSPLOWO2_01_FULL_38_20]